MGSEEVSKMRTNWPNVNNITVTAIAMRESVVEKPSEPSELDRPHAQFVEDGSCSSADDEEDVYMLPIHFDDVIAAVDELRYLRFDEDVGQRAGIRRWITDQLTSKQSQ